MLLTLLALLAKPQAEEEFRRLETALVNASTARIKSRTVITFEGTPGHSQVLESEVLLKDRGRAFLSKRDMGDPENSLVLLTDGVKAKMRQGTGQTYVISGREELTAFLRHNIARKGLPAGNLKRVLELSNFRMGEEEDGARTLMYTLQESSPINGWSFYEVKLWYESGTGKLLKRRTKDELRRISQTEVYSEYLLGEDVPDWKFSFPRDY